MPSAISCTSVSISTTIRVHDSRRGTMWYDSREKVGAPPMSDVIVYGAPWCPDCRRAKKFLGEHRVNYDWTDIDQNPDALRTVEELQGGGRTIPTVVFSDGSHFVDPTNEQLAR